MGRSVDSSETVDMLGLMLRERDGTERGGLVDIRRHVEGTGWERGGAKSSSVSSSGKLRVERIVLRRRLWVDGLRINSSSTEAADGGLSERTRERKQVPEEET